MSPTQRTLAALRSDGWTAAVVEHWNPHAHIRQDLFGWCDVLAVRREPLAFTEAFCDGKYGTLGVQCTTADHAADRRTKLSACEAARTCVFAGWRVEVWGWDTRRAEAAACSICGGTGTRAYCGERGKCPGCHGSGKGKRPKRRAVVCLRWRMDANGEWEGATSNPAS